ncbi:MAG: sugar transferase [Desulfatiglandaceae bacterium]
MRTMRVDPSFQTMVTRDHDPRITRVGRLLRKAKLDELPQLVQVLWPDKVRLNREYVENWSFWGDIRIILKTGKII